MSDTDLRERLKTEQAAGITSDTQAKTPAVKTTAGKPEKAPAKNASAEIQAKALAEETMADMQAKTLAAEMTAGIPKKIPAEEAAPAGEQADTGLDSESEPAVSETWAEETIADLDDFIESQGIYIRQ